jgi:hypothetical protein
MGDEGDSLLENRLKRLLVYPFIEIDYHKNQFELPERSNDDYWLENQNEPL